MARRTTPALPLATRERILSVSRELMLRRGFGATSLDDVSEAVGIRKASLFHHFTGKDELGEEVLRRFFADLEREFVSGAYLSNPAALGRLFGYVDFTEEVLARPILRDGCLIGIFSQELGRENPKVRAICADSFRRWANAVETLLKQAIAEHPPAHSFDAALLGRHFVASVEGGLLLDRVDPQARQAEANVRLYREHLQLLFGQQRK